MPNPAISNGRAAPVEKKTWLYDFLAACVADFNDEDAKARIDAFKKENHHVQADEVIRRWVEHKLRNTGVVYGTPLASEETIASYTLKGYAQRWGVFLAILKIQAELAMEIGCEVKHCTVGNIRVAELLVCLAMLCRKFQLAEKIHEHIRVLPECGNPSVKFLKLVAKVEKIVPRQAYLAGNPLLGLPIHNSFNYVNAKTMGRIAVAYFEHGVTSRKKIQRVLDYEDREKELLLRAMVGLASADHPLGVGSQRVVIQQIKSAQLGWKTRRSLLRMLKKQVSPLSVAAVVNDERARDFLLEQIILGSMLDGYVSEGESHFIGDLAGWLEVSPEDLAHREAQVVQFYEQHKAYLDLFTVGSAVHYYRQRMIDRLQDAIKKNLDLIVEEIRNTKDLADLLFRASRGEKLIPEERKRMGRELVGILRTIPSLAIFSLPFGVVLLPLVFRVLPEGMKPRAFSGHSRNQQNTGSGKDFF